MPQAPHKQGHHKPGREAKTFDLQVGDPVLMGKYKNSPGRIEGFGVSDKGDPTVKVRKKPKGDRGQGALKEVNLFKIRLDEAQAKQDKEAADRVAARFLRSVLAGQKPKGGMPRTASDHTQAYHRHAPVGWMSRVHPGYPPPIGNTTHDNQGLPLKDASILLQTLPIYGISVAGIPRGGGDSETRWNEALIDIITDPENTRKIDMPGRIKDTLDFLIERAEKALVERDRKIEQMGYFGTPSSRRMTRIASAQAAWRLSGSDLPKVYHASRNRIQRVTQALVGERDEGWYGEGFYVAEDPEYVLTWYGPVLTTLSVDPKAKVLQAAIEAADAPSGLFEAVLANEKALLRDRDALDHASYVASLIKDNQIEWVHAVDRLAEKEGFDVIRFDPTEIVVKNLDVLDVVQSGKSAAERLATGTFKNKKTVKNQKGEDQVVYEYSERQVQNRHREKADRVEKLRGNLHKLRSQVTKDLKAKDPKTWMAALAVGLINDTYERVGNDESAKEGHFGVTGWQAKHVSISGGKATISYVGKSGVKQTKTVTDTSLVSALKTALKGKSGTDPVFDSDGTKVGASEVNEYLKTFDITAKDIRGLHANREMQTRLKAIRSKGGTLPKDKAKREKKLKDEFKKALDETAAAVGHEASTLKSQYLVPGLEDDFLKDGTVNTKLNKKASSDKRLFRLFERRGELWSQREDGHGQWACPFCQATGRCRCPSFIHAARGVDPDRVSTVVCWECEQRLREAAGLRHAPSRTKVATKSEAENEEEEVERLNRRNPEKKPPRKDLRRNRMREGDPDLDTGGAERDPDLSLNYKKIGGLAERFLRYVVAGEGKHKPGDVWQADSGTWVAMNPKGVTHTFGDDEKAKEQATAYAKGKGDEGGDSDKADAAEADAQKRQRAKSERQRFKGDVQALADSLSLSDEAREALDAALEQGDELFEAFKAERRAMEQILERGITAEMMKDARKDPFKGIDTSDPAQVAEAMVKSLVRDRLLLDPTYVGGKPLSSTPLSEEDRVARSEQAMRLYRHVSSEQRVRLAEKAAEALAELDPESPEAVEMNAVIDGIHAAFELNDEQMEVAAGGKGWDRSDDDEIAELNEKLQDAINPDQKKELEQEIKLLERRIKRKRESPSGGLLREPLNEKLRSVLRTMVNQGNAKFLFLSDPAQIYEREGREAVRDALGELDDASLIEMSEGTPWEPLGEVLGSYTLEPEVAEYVRALMRDMSVNSMTTVQGMAASIARKKMDPAHPAEVYEQVAKDIAEHGREDTKKAVSTFLEKCREGGGDLDTCIREQSETIQRVQFQNAVKAVDDMDTEPEPTNVPVAVARAIANGAPVAMAEQKWEPDDPQERLVQQVLQAYRDKGQLLDADRVERYRKMSPSGLDEVLRVIQGQEPKSGIGPRIV